MRSTAFRIALPTAISLLAVQAAYADLTAQDVWADWKGYLTENGYTVEGTENAQGRGLIIDDVMLKFESPDLDVNASMDMGQIKFSQEGDGSIRFDMADSIPVKIGGDDGELAIAGVLTQTNMNIRVSGAPGDLAYKFDGDTVKFALTEFAADGEETPESLRAVLNMQGISGVSTSKEGDLSSYGKTGKINALTYDIAMEGMAGAEGNFDMSGALNDVAFDFDLLMPAGGAPFDYQKALQEGMEFVGKMTFGTGSGKSTTSTPDGSYTSTSTSGPGTLDMAMSKEGLTYAGTQTSSNMTFEVAGLPMPLSFTAGMSQASLTLPVLQSDEEQNFSMLFDLQDLALSDSLWDMFDPGKVLPRDAANLKLDFGGVGKLRFNIFDMENIEAEMEKASSGDLTSLTLNALLLELAGAKLTGDGAVAFSVPEGADADAIPDADGALNLALEGGNGLMDKLVELGFLPEDQVMSARMMRGMFTVPGEGDDSVKTKLEINKEGHISVNGNRVK